MLEYKDYSWEWPHNRRGYLPCAQYTSVAAQYAFWRNCQNVIVPELDLLALEGWKPITNDLSSGIQLNRYKALHLDGGMWIIVLFFSIPMFGLPVLLLFLGAPYYYEPTGYQMKLRRINR